MNKIIHADCLEEMRKMEDNSISAIVTDPPYGLHFMDKDWDHGIPGISFWQEALRICKPGSHLLSFGGTRTYHRLTCAIEDAGFEIRDCLMWIYGSGFPKSHNHFGLEGYGTALKPAHEIVIAAQRPLSKDMEQDIIVGSLIKLWCQLCLLLPVNVAEKISTSNHILLKEVESFAQMNVEQRSAIQESLCGQMDMLQFVETMTSCLSIVASWKNTLEDHWKDGNMSITKTEINPIIDLKILRFYLSQLTPLTIIQEEIKQHGSWLTVLNAARYLNAVVNNIRNIQELSVLGNVTFQDGLNLCPNYEPIIMTMKPCDDTFKQNVEKWGQGGINIDGSRIDQIPRTTHKEGNYKGHDKNGNIYNLGYKEGHFILCPKGRWPANILFDEEAAKILDEQSGNLKSGDLKPYKRTSLGGYHGSFPDNTESRASSSGGASRFFYCAKASSSERNEGLNEQKNNHPTVKPLKLMEYLIKLVMPPKDGILLDPFAGSGTTILAAKRLGFNAIGIEKCEEYAKIAATRVDNYIQQMDLF